MTKADMLREAVSLHGRAVYNLALQVTGDPAAAEDATQEAFTAHVREAGRIRDPKAEEAKRYVSQQLQKLELEAHQADGTP